MARAETLPFKSYTTSDGLAHDRVNRIVRDSRGFLWFCTSEGLSRFDGYEFKNYTQDDGLPHRAVHVFLETSDGDLWIGTGDGLVLFNPRGGREQQNAATPTPLSMFRVFRPEVWKTPDPVSIQDLIQDHSGLIWVATSHGLYQLVKTDDWHLRPLDVPASIENKNDDFSRLLEDHTGSIWAAAGAGLYRISADRSAIQTIHNTLRAGSMIEARSGVIWIGSVGGTESEIGLHLFSITGNEPHKIRTFRKRDGLAEEIWLNSLLETSDGRILVGIGNGISEYQPSAGAGQPQFRTLSKEAIVDLGEDASGNIWFSTNSTGVGRLARGGFVNFTESDNLLLKSIGSIVSADDGLYVLGEASNIHRFDNGNFTVVAPLNMIPQSWGRGRVSFRDHTGAWWIAGNTGLQRYPPVEKLEDLGRTRPLKTYTTRDGLFSDVIFQLFEDSRGDIWIGCIGGGVDSLARWERSTESIHRYSSEHYGLPQNNPVTAFTEDSAGNTWIGYYNGGLARFRAGKFDVFGAENNVPSGYIGNLFTDSAGRVWVATSSRGVIRIDDPDNDRPRLINITTGDGLSSNQATCTTEDSFGRIYISTGRGVNRLDLRNGRIKVFTKADGLPENIVRLCGRDREGALWFGTWSGLGRYVPTADEQGASPPVFFSDVRVNGESIDKLSQLGETSLQNLDFASDQRQIQVDFFALGFGVGESLLYQYKFDGTGADWSDPSPQRTVNLSLSPGNYNFLVRAINAEGMVSDNPARLSFSIARPIWQRSWFLLIVATMIALTIYVVYRYRLKQMLKLERVRTRIATDLHDDIGSSLSQIAILSEVARHKMGDNGASEPLRRIADTSRDMVDSMSDIVWAINPQKDHLSDLIHRMRRFAGDTFDSTDVAYRFQFDEATRDIDVGADLRREVYLIFKECINNTAKHSGADNVEMSIKVTGDLLSVTVVDNGRGFDIGKALSGEFNGFGGNGLLNMRKRVERLGGEFSIDSNIGTGTTISFKIPTGRTSAPAGVRGWRSRAGH
jgi:signal transduction histidine kinase/ligand-binding sensor domain-containing protein